MLLRKRQSWIAGLGGLTLALAILIGRFAPEFEGVDFVVGMLFGLSIVFNISALLNYRAIRANKRS